MSQIYRQVAELPLPESGQNFHTDRAIPGSGVRVSQGGTKTFVLIVGEHRRRITMGRSPSVPLTQA